MKVLNGATFFEEESITVPVCCEIPVSSSVFLPSVIIQKPSTLQFVLGAICVLFSAQLHQSYKVIFRLINSIGGVHSPNNK